MFAKEISSPMDALTPMSHDSSNGIRKNHIVVKFLLAVAVLVGFSLVLHQFDFIQFFLKKERVISFLDSLGPWSFAGFIALQAFQVVAPPVPGDVTGFLGGFLYGPLIGLLLSTIGLTIGSYVAFALARAFGKPFVEKFISRQTLGRFNYLLQHKGAFIVFLMFLIPGFPKDYLCYILGLGELSTTEFLVIGGSGRLFGTILLTLGGSYIRLHNYVSFFILIGAAFILLFLALAYKDKLERLFRLWHVRNRRRRNSRRPDITPQ